MQACSIPSFLIVSEPKTCSLLFPMYCCSNREKTLVLCEAKVNDNTFLSRLCPLEWNCLHVCTHILLKYNIGIVTARASELTLYQTFTDWYFICLIYLIISIFRTFYTDTHSHAVWRRKTTHTLVHNAVSYPHVINMASKRLILAINVKKCFVIHV